MSAIKAAQAVNFFLEQNANDPQSVDGDQYLKLIKLLWAADRHSLRNFGSEVTEDHYFALPYGPVASETYDLMKACRQGAEMRPDTTSQSDTLWWREHFETRRYALHRLADPGSDHLSPADILMLEEAYVQFRESGGFETARNISHIYPEWTRAYDSRSSVRAFPIDLVDFFDDPENHEDQYFQVDPETLEAARYFYNERAALSSAIGIEL
ncbi:SocA family protein [Corynebacterium zhongnanshanii]|nr:Panacea domain-containing protein [Corynebacterium zhongnanshanii]QNP92571.1 SocA family protein [Corynebacterium zhongnanshanii]